MKEQLAERILNRCDLFLYQDIRANNVYGSELASSPIVASIHNDNCQLISIPNYYGLPKFMFPQNLNGYVLHMSNFMDSNTSWQRDIYIDSSYSKMNVNQLCEMINGNCEFFTPTEL